MMSKASSAAVTAAPAWSSSRYQVERQFSSFASSLRKPAPAKSSCASLPARRAASMLPPTAFDLAMACSALPSILLSPTSFSRATAAPMMGVASSAPFFLSPFFAMCSSAAASIAAPSIFLSPSSLNIACASAAILIHSSAISGFFTAISESASVIFASPLLSPDDLKVASDSCANWYASRSLPCPQRARLTRRRASAVPALSPTSLKMSSADCAGFSACSGWPTSMQASAEAARVAASFETLPAICASDTGRRMGNGCRVGERAPP
mmetsp:Transcript_65565/g.168762  ORF Transcript_65565/g.168762 Transcript_65565/m.168762 type:complete len:267 (+) Transcript_65565:511-1311(+)